MQPTDDALEVMVGQLLEVRNLTLAVAESCTGGLIGHRFTNVPGSSGYFRGAVIAYANDVKESLLGVRSKTLAEHGAVSEQTAREMAAGVREAVSADVGVSVTGIAGPGGGTGEKPVGLVFVALVAEDVQRAEKHLFRGNRWTNKMHSADAVFRLLQSYLEGLS